ncbi:MAG: hypothetical protein P4L69_20860 [Desulfosporosinus sp.]|nr:hypothetical protein [Desulfosporosinus sp.]
MMRNKPQDEWVNGGMGNVIIFAEPFSCPAVGFINGRFDQHFGSDLFFLVLVGSSSIMRQHPDNQSRSTSNRRLFVFPTSPKTPQSSNTPFRKPPGAFNSYLSPAFTYLKNVI